MDILYLFRDCLQGIPGIKLFVFTDPIAAYEHFKYNESKYALVLSDYRMPGMDGMELIKKIKDTKQSVRTILMTAFQTNDKLFHEYTSKKIINGFLQKPVKIEDIRNEVRKQLDT
jgi:DNA-binding NtrC family response regulator